MKKKKKILSMSTKKTKVVMMKLYFQKHNNLCSCHQLDTSILDKVIWKRAIEICAGEAKVKEMG